VLLETNIGPLYI